MSNPYLIVSPDMLTRLQEAANVISEIRADLENEVYRADVLYDENCHLRTQYELRCDEKNELFREIERLQAILTKAGIEFKEEVEHV